MPAYLANSHGVHFEDFNGENVIVNLNLGNYYSLRHSASCLWDALQQGVLEADLVTDLVDFYQLDSAMISQDVQHFLAELSKEQLIIPTSITLGQHLDVSKLPAQYLAPELEVFNDLQQLFLLDPVHAVDSQMGWPFQA